MEGRSTRDAEHRGEGNRACPSYHEERRKRWRIVESSTNEAEQRFSTVEDRANPKGPSSVSFIALSSEGLPQDVSSAAKDCRLRAQGNEGVHSHLVMRLNLFLAILPDFVAGALHFGHDRRSL